MTVVTVFRSRLREGSHEQYAPVAQEMNDLVRSMDGFVDVHYFEAADGERVTIVRFRDLDTQRAWANHREHRAAQKRGRDEFYSWYDISVSVQNYSATFAMTIES